MTSVPNDSNYEFQQSIVLKVVETVIETATEEMAVQEKISKADFCAVLDLAESAQSRKSQVEPTLPTSDTSLQYYNKLQNVSKKVNFSS